MPRSPSVGAVGRSRESSEAPGDPLRVIAADRSGGTVAASLGCDCFQRRIVVLDVAGAFVGRQHRHRQGRGAAMKSFRLVPASEGPRREFKITLGLRAGYGPAGRIYDLEEAVRTAHRWMMERAARGAPFLSGISAAAKSSTPIPEAETPVIESRSRSSPARFFRNMPVTLTMAPCESCSMSWRKRWAGRSNRRRCISRTAAGHGR
jgi:hypothetical protein